MTARCEFNVWVDADDERGFRAYSGFAPGLIAYGGTIAEALSNFADGYANREDDEPAWNRVTLGDGRQALLLPAPVTLNRICEKDGRNSCWHTDQTPCDRTGHETVQVYYVSVVDDSSQQIPANGAKS